MILKISLFGILLLSSQASFASFNREPKRTIIVFSEKETRSTESPLTKEADEAERTESRLRGQIERRIRNEIDASFDDLFEN